MQTFTRQLAYFPGLRFVCIDICISDTLFVQLLQHIYLGKWNGDTNKPNFSYMCTYIYIKSDTKRLWQNEDKCHQCINKMADKNL